MRSGMYFAMPFSGILTKGEPKRKEREEEREMRKEDEEDEEERRRERGVQERQREGQEPLTSLFRNLPTSFQNSKIKKGPRSLFHSKQGSQGLPAFPLPLSLSLFPSSSAPLLQHFLNQWAVWC